jgi:hypothetical protein
LTPASGRRDHTTSPSALALFVNSTAASTASLPASVTIASRPSVGRDGGSCRFDLPDGESGIFLQMGLDNNLLICPSGNALQFVASPLRDSRHTPRKRGIQYAAAFRLYR